MMESTTRRRIEDWRMASGDDQQEHLRADLARALQTPLYLPTDSARLGQSTHSHHQRNHHHRATLAGIPSASFPLPSHAAKPSAPSSPEVLRQALASALCLSPRLSRADRVTRRNTVPYMTSLQRARLEEQRQGLLIEESSEDEAANHLFYLSPSSSNSSTGSADVQSRDVELRSTAPRTDFSKDEQSVSSTRGKNERSVQDRFQNWTNSSADREPNNNHKLSTTLNETRRASEGDAVSSHAACAPSSGDPDWRRSSADSAHAQFDANRWSERSGTFPSFLWPPSLGEDLGSLPDFFRGDLYQNLPYGATFPPAYPASFPSTALFSHWGSPRNNVSGGSFDSLYSMGSFPSTNSSIQSVGDFSVSVQSAKDPSVATSQWRGENASFRGSVDSSSSTSASSGCQAGKEGEERQRQGRHRHARDKKRVTFIELVDDSQTPALVDTTGKVVEKLTDKVETQHSGGAGNKTVHQQQTLSARSYPRDNSLTSSTYSHGPLVSDQGMPPGFFPNVYPQPFFPPPTLNPPFPVGGSGGFPRLCGQCMAREVAAPPPVYFAPIGRVLFDMLTKKQPPSTPPKSPVKSPDDFEANLGCCQACRERVYRHRRMPSDPGACSHWSRSVHVQALTSAATPEESWKALRDFINCQSRQISISTGFPWSQGQWPEPPFPAASSKSSQREFQGGAGGARTENTAAEEKGSGDASHGQPADGATLSPSGISSRKNETHHSPRRSPQQGVQYSQSRRQHQQQLQREQQEHQQQQQRHQQRKLQRQQHVEEEEQDLPTAQRTPTPPAQLPISGLPVNPRQPLSGEGSGSGSGSGRTGSDLDDLYVPMQKGEMMEMTADFLLFCLAIKAAFNPQPPP